MSREAEKVRLVGIGKDEGKETEGRVTYVGLYAVEMGWQGARGGISYRRFWLKHGYAGPRSAKSGWRIHEDDLARVKQLAHGPRVDPFYRRR